MYIAGIPRRGHEYYTILRGVRAIDKTTTKTAMYLGRLDNIDEIKRLELERKIRELGEPELITKFRLKLQSIGYKFPSFFSTMSVEEVYDFGLPIALHKICEDIQLVDVVDRHGYKGGGPSLGKLVEAMAIHRICEPGSHRELVRWYPTTALPVCLAVPPAEFTHKIILNALDYLQPERTVPMQVELYDNIRKVYGYKCNRLDIDLTSTYFEGFKCLLVRFGYSRDKRSDRPQIVIAFIVDNEGVLVTHKVWPGDRTDAKSLKPVERLLREEFGLDCPRVMDRGIATWEKLNYMDRKKERYLVALRAKAKSTGLLDEIETPRSRWEDVGEGQVATSVVKGRRKYVISWNASVAEEWRGERLSRVKKAEEELRTLQRRIAEGKIASRQERDEEIGHILKKHRVSKFIEPKCERKGFGFRFARTEKLGEANRYEGYQIFVTTEKHLTERDVVSSYRARDEVEKAICSLKSALGLRPMYVWTAEHIIGQTFICAQAYQLRSVLAMKLGRSDLGMSVEDAMWKLDRLKAVKIIATGDETRVFRKVTTMDNDQLALVDIFNIKDAYKEL